MDTKYILLNKLNILVYTQMNTELGPFKLIKSKINPAEAVFICKTQILLKQICSKLSILNFLTPILRCGIQIWG